jgi:hypothetical protein
MSNFRRPAGRETQGEMQMPRDDPLAVASLCRLEASRTDCADMRSALMSLARAIEAANAESSGREVQPAQSGPGSIETAQIDTIIAALLLARGDRFGPRPSSQAPAAATRSAPPGPEPTPYGCPADGADGSDKRRGVVLSHRNGSVWVSWEATTTSIEMGPADEVIEMMRDFLAQTDLGERLARRAEPLRRIQ